MIRTGVSLFAGVGGFDLAMQRNGVQVVASVEIDKACNQVLAKQFPDARQFTDITTTKGSDLIDAGFRASGGIITGGFPCQDLSVAGKRAGLAGERSGLFWHAARLVEETQSEWFIIENVPGLLSSNGGKDFGIVLRTMAELGYSVAWRILDAQYFGVPQRRRRVFIVGRRASEHGPAEVLFKSEGLRRDTTQSQQEGQDITGSTTEGARSASWWNGGQISDTLTRTSNENRMPDKNKLQVIIENPIVGTLQARDYKGVGNQYVAENKLVVQQEQTSTES